jgi:ribosome-associated protein
MGLWVYNSLLKSRSGLFIIFELATFIVIVDATQCEFKGKVMNLKQELQELNDKLDKFRRKLAAAEQRGDTAIIMQFKREITAVTKRIANVKGQQTRQLNKEGGEVRNLPFKRELTKAEQADMGKLKKSVKGLVVIHPMTALGREMGLKVVTGFAPSKF